MTLDEAQLNMLRIFHLVVFRDMLRVVKSFQTMDYSKDAPNGILCVPMIGRKIDLDLALKYQNLPQMKPLTERERLSMRITPEDYLHRVVCTWYRADNTQRYVVTKILTDQTPSSRFPEPQQAPTYGSYFTTRYGSEIGQIVNMNQFLVEVKGITKDFNLLNPGMQEKGSKKQGRKFRSEVFIPELSHNFTFPADMWLKALLLPNVIHRIHYMLHAENLRKTIDAYIGVRSTKKLDCLIVNKRNFTIMEQVAPKRSIFGAPADSVPEKVEQKHQTLSDILDSLFMPDDLPVDIHRNWDNIDVVDLDYYSNFMNFTDEFKKEKARKGKNSLCFIILFY